MAQMHAALVKEQGITFVVVQVKNHVVNSQSESNKIIQAAALSFGCRLVVLMGESNQKLRGSRQDVVNFVAGLHPSQLPWKKWTV